MPWQDIIGIQAWENVLNTYLQGTMAFGGRQKTRFSWATLKRSRVLPDYMESLTRQIRQYHGIEKRSVDNLPMRAGLLRMIAANCKTFMAKNNIKGKNAVKANMGGAGPQYDAYKQSLDYAVSKIGRRAKRKADYIETLREHIANADRGFTNKQNLFEYLKQKEERAFPGPLVGLASSVVMERVDPWHRPIGAVIKPTRRQPVGGTANTSEISVAFARWAQAASQAPFFVWLEGHGICTGDYTEDPALETGLAQGRYEKLGGTVTYNHADACTVAPLNSQLWIYRLTPQHILVKTAFDTSDAKGNSTKSDQLFNQGRLAAPAYAYVWSRDGVIFANMHRTAFVHHSSMESGKKVKCSGMIAVKNGKIHHVDNNSGHYQPGSHHLLNFVRWLNKQGVFDANARIRDEAAHKSYSVNEFLRQKPSIPSKANRPPVSRQPPPIPSKANRPSMRGRP